MISEYENNIKLKRNELYNEVTQRYREGYKSPKGFTMLLELIFFDQEKLGPDKPYACTVGSIVKLSMQKKPSIKFIYDLLRRDDLYQALNALDICPGYFIALLSDYVDYTCSLHEGFNAVICKEWDFTSGSDSCQMFYNQRVRDVLERLKVFYD